MASRSARVMLEVVEGRVVQLTSCCRSLCSVKIVRSMSLVARGVPFCSCGRGRSCLCRRICWQRTFGGGWRSLRLLGLLYVNSKAAHVVIAQGMLQRYAALSKTYGHVASLCRQTCEGVFSWRYYPWVDWKDDSDNGQLKTVTYKKLRNDTILRVTFHSAFSQYSHGKCSEYHIQFGGHECTQPAIIVNTLHIDNYASSGQWQSIPAEVSGFCNATSQGQLLPGNIQVSVHVKLACSGGNAHTGKFYRGRVTSYFLIEEYCLWWWEFSSGKFQHRWFNS